MTSLERLGHGLVAGLYLAMAWLQINDPDPLYWVSAYLLAAWLPACRVLGGDGRRLSAYILGVLLAGVLMSAPGFIDYLLSGDHGSLFDEMSPDRPYVESARELLGLLIALAGVGFYARRSA